MSKHKVIIQKTVSSDGKNTAVAKSVAIASGDNESTISQVIVKSSIDKSSSSSSKSSALAC